MSVPIDNNGKIITESDFEAVNHPFHYCRGGAIECIDEMELVFGAEATAHFCLLNCWKYRYRSNEKNGQQDIEKSDWYMQKYKELKEKPSYKIGSDNTYVPHYIQSIPNNIINCCTDKKIKG